MVPQGVSPLLGPPGSRATWRPVSATAQKPRVRKCLQPNNTPWFGPALANRRGGGGAGESERPITSRPPRRGRGFGFHHVGFVRSANYFFQRQEEGCTPAGAAASRALPLRRDRPGGCSSPSTMCDGAPLPPLALPLLLLLLAWGPDPGTGSAPFPAVLRRCLSGTPLPLPSRGIQAARAPVLAALARAAATG